MRFSSGERDPTPAFSVAYSNKKRAVKKNPVLSMNDISQEDFSVRL